MTLCELMCPTEEDDEDPSSLTESRASTVIGMFISVTTTSAASDIGLSISHASWSEAWVSFLHVSILIIVGMIMLLAQKRIWDRVTPTDRTSPSPSSG